MSEEITVPKIQHLISMLKGYYTEHGYRWDEENIILIRGTKDYYTNKFLCFMALASDSDILVLRATTVPGPFWTPENRKRFGVTEEILCLGYVKNAYRVGNHMGHPEGFAMVQAADFPAWRDNNRNSIQDAGETTFTVRVGAGDNIHTQKPGDTDDRVDFASAACQVAKDRVEFLGRFMPRIRATQKFKTLGAGARFDRLLTQFDEFPLFEQFKERVIGL